jgi:hypothetical protein
LVGACVPPHSSSAQPINVARDIPHNVAGGT